MNDQPPSNGELRPGSRHDFIASWKAAQAGNAATDSDISVYPYPGLRSFKPNEADLFYGRDNQIKELRERLGDNNIIVVLGGSGSGKSSLVRAGLIPQLNSTAPIPGRAGAWYVVEFRPKLDPATELFDAIFSQIIAPILAPRSQAGHAGSASSSAQAAGAAERERRIAALNTAFGLHCDPHADQAALEQQCRAQLRELLFEGDVVDVGALFDFVDDALPKLDRALSGGVVSDAPNLMILIDQFEEVFKPKVNAAGRDMVMSLITSVHAYKPFNLFVIVTMRSEELHRCAEFLGLAEVVNKSLYLVDLIGGRDIEQAIVGPVRRLLRSWELDPGSPDTGPFTRAALSKLHVVFDEGRDVLSHPADQLPLMQHMLPLVWERAVQRWHHSGEGKPLDIDVRDLEALRGWSSEKGSLIGTLNARADKVLSRAIEVGSKKSGLDPGSVEQLLRVGFCCLAQLDDRGNVVRDFATIDQMLEASGVVERKADQQDLCRQALAEAFQVFQSATLVNIARNYDVNHEALIRGWNKYTDWLRDAQRRASRLVSVDQQIQGSVTPAARGANPLTRQIDRIVDWINVQRLARADQIAGDETSVDLQDVVGPSRTFSDRWAQRVLERADSAVPAGQIGRPSPTDRLNAIRQTINDATYYRAGAKYRPRWLLGLLLVAIAATGGYLWIQSQRVKQQEQLAEQFRFFRLQKEATSSAIDRPRFPAEDREVYAALHMEAELGKRAALGEARMWFKNSLRQLEGATRELVSDESIRIVANNFQTLQQNADFAELKPQESQCAVVNAALTPRNLISQRNLGIQLRQVELGKDVQTVVMAPVWRATDGTVSDINSSSFKGISPPPGSLVCLSHDANWFMMWPPLLGDQSGSPPLLQRIVWIRTARMSDKPDADWHAQALPYRNPATWQSRLNLATPSEEYAELRTGVEEGRQPIKSFRIDDRAGFLLPLKSDRLAVLWTSTGAADPDPFDGKLSFKLPDCSFRPIAKTDTVGGSGQFMNCNTGSVYFENEWHQVQAEYYATQATSKDVLRCENASALCQVELAVLFPDGSTRISITHLSSVITGAAIHDGFLWVGDTNGQVWRYLVGTQRMKSLLTHRWKGLSVEILSKTPYSEGCRQAEPCATILIPGWSQQTGKAP